MNSEPIKATLLVIGKVNTPVPADAFTGTAIDNKTFV